MQQQQKKKLLENTLRLFTLHKRIQTVEHMTYNESMGF